LSVFLALKEKSESTFFLFSLLFSFFPTMLMTLLMSGSG
jgi:hypothetical protein